jgi:hypothetical protein
MQQSRTTIHLKLPDPRQLLIPAPVSLAICVVALGGILAAIGRIQSAPAIAVPTPGLPIIIIATAQPVAVPLVEPVQQIAQAPVGNVTRRAIVVYGAADLATAIGAVEPGRAFTPVAHYGADWMIVDMDGSGRVYVQVSDVYDLPPGLADMRPAPAPQVIYVQPAHVEQPYQVDTPPAPEPTTAPQAQPAIVAPVVSAPAPAPAADHAPPPSPPDDVTRALMQEAWRQEHCVAGKCMP